MTIVVFLFKRCTLVLVFVVSKQSESFIAFIEIMIRWIFKGRDVSTPDGVVLTAKVMSVIPVTER